jgi:2-keto-3-deoxy-L-rhamnonate aldolase RhmA
MDRPQGFKEKMHNGGVCFGTCVTFSDLAVSEALGSAGLDFLWIDAEHAPLSIETIQTHVLAAELAGVMPIVRVPWNDPVLIKQALDVGAIGIIAPLIRTAAEARRVVAACRYPPHGIRGYGPRRPSNYGRTGGLEFCQTANENVIPIVQIEHIEAVNNIDEILETPGVEVIVIGPNDLSGSMGLITQTRHPEVLRAIETVIAKARERGVFVGMGIGEDVQAALEWVGKGVQWVALGSDTSLLVGAIDRIMAAMREGIKAL